MQIDAAQLSRSIVKDFGGGLVHRETTPLSMNRKGLSGSAQIVSGGALGSTIKYTTVGGSG